MRVPLFATAQRGKSPNVTAQRRLNLYAEPQREADKTSLAFYGTPGLVLFTALPAVTRGVFVFEGRLFAVAGATLYEISAAGSLTTRGTLLTNSGRVQIDCNGVQLMIVDDVYGYAYGLVTNVLTRIVDADFPIADSVSFDSGFGIVNKVATGRFQISALYDFLTWGALDFATAESSPDNLVRIFADNGQLILFGTTTSEFWSNSGALDFPYNKIGSAVIEWGLLAKNSVAKFNGRVCCLMRNKLGQQQVVVINGYSPLPISTPEIDFLISQYAKTNDAEAFSYSLGGHPFYQITFPAANKTWLYDGLSNAWSELESSGARHRAALGLAFGGDYLVTDFENGNIYRLGATTYTDNGAAITRRIVGRHIFDEDWKSITKMWIDMETGVGLVSGQGVSPQLMMRISKDGGNTWSSERYASLGALGVFAARAVFRRCGRARDFVYEFTITDPVKPVFIGAWVDAA